MASSSGCAIKRHIRLLYNCGNERANGEEDVEERPQKMMTAEMARPIVNKSADDDIVFFCNWNCLGTLNKLELRHLRGSSSNADCGAVENAVQFIASSVLGVWSAMQWPRYWLRM